MNKLFRNIIGLSLFAILGLGITGCNKFLDLLPENSQTSDMYWNNKEDVEAVVFSLYKGMQGCLEQYVEWGELRGDALELSDKATQNEQDIVDLQIHSDNGICNWANLYTVIGRANSIIKYAPTVLEKDPTFLPEVLNSYLAEAKFARALSYYYLVRTFQEVPLVLEPYVDDHEPFMKAKTTERAVLDQILDDLHSILKTIKPGYGTVAQNKGRATKWAAYALLADVCLWDEKYQECIDACDEIFKSNSYTLVDKNLWFEIFWPGNSSESIFELQWGVNTGGNNSLPDWFYTSPRYTVSQTTIELFYKYRETDTRGENVTFVADNNKVWKFIGSKPYYSSDAQRTGNNKYSNWIFYRLPDIYFMKAEALVMLKNNTEGYKEAHELVKAIRERAGFTMHPEIPDNEKDALEMIMNERLCEFVGEGKRWFDILRVAHRENFKYKDMLIELLLKNISAKYRPIYLQKLQDTRGYYLPIAQKEIEANSGVLIQNPYYNED